ncbi:MAG: hypothetical protein KGZ58_04745 [Ignavibacteriales bacterium]|nr:hypothetical protein [Ignavibacteriales bacterium]
MDLQINLEQFEKTIDNKLGTILFHRPGFQGIPDEVLHGDGYTVELKNREVVIIDIYNPSSMMTKVIGEDFQRKAA